MIIVFSNLALFMILKIFIWNISFFKKFDIIMIIILQFISIALTVYAYSFYKINISIITLTILLLLSILYIMLFMSLNRSVSIKIMQRLHSSPSKSINYTEIITSNINDRMITQRLKQLILFKIIKEKDDLYSSTIVGKIIARIIIIMRHIFGISPKGEGY